MTQQGFSVGTYLCWGWRLMRKHFWLFAGFVLVTMVINLAMSLTLAHNIGGHPAINLVLHVIAYLISYTVTIGLYQVGLNFVEFGSASVWDLFLSMRKMFKVLIANFLWMILVAVGLVLFVIPGIYWWVKYSQIIFLILDKDIGPIEAFKRSGEITAGAKWDLFALMILTGFIEVLGVLALFVGVFATIPLTILTHVLVYRHLVKGGEDESIAAKSCCVLK